MTFETKKKSFKIRNQRRDDEKEKILKAENKW